MPSGLIDRINGRLPGSATSGHRHQRRAATSATRPSRFRPSADDTHRLNADDPTGRDLTCRLHCVAAVAAQDKRSRGVPPADTAHGDDQQTRKLWPAEQSLFIGIARLAPKHGSRRRRRGALACDTVDISAQFPKRRHPLDPEQGLHCVFFEGRFE